MRVNFDSATDLVEDPRRAATGHGRHEVEIGRADPDRSGWNARGMVNEHAVRPGLVSSGTIS